MFTQNELDFDDHPICNEFPGASSMNGWDYVIDGGHGFAGKLVENERLRLRAVRNQIFQDLNVLADAIQRETDS